jgi:hypothetical protein
MKGHPAIELKLIERLLELRAIRFDLTIDLLASRTQIICDLDKALRQFIPYRPIDPRIFEAIALMEREGDLGYVDASLRVFGTADHAGKIRNWYNKVMR